MRIFEITKSEAVAQTVEDFAKAGALLGEVPPPLSWGVATLLAVVGIAASAWLYCKAHSRIAYWV